MLFLVLMMLSGVSEDLDVVRYTTLYSLFDPAEIIAGAILWACVWPPWPRSSWRCTFWAS